jgi:stage III sporulation protein AD
MNIVMITGLCIVSTIICKIYEKSQKEYVFLISLAGASFILFLTVSYISPIISSAQSIFSSAWLSGDYLEIIFKAIGICYLTQLGSDYCKDAGENAFATQLEMCGKISILIIALPLFSALLDIIEKLTAL